MKLQAPAFAFFGLLVALTVAVPASAQAPVTLRYGHYQPRGPAVEGEGWFAEEVTKRTGGKVKIEVGWAEAYGKARELPETVKSSAVDLATVVRTSIRPVPVHRLSPMPLFASDPLRDLERQYQIASTVYRTAPFEEEMARTFNSKPLFQQLIAPYWALGKVAGCTTGTFQGKKIRTLGADAPKMFSAIGAVPVSLTTPELYEALQRGTVDYLSIPTTHMRTLKLSEVGKHACGPVFMLTMGHTTVINLDTWKKLAPDVRKVILDVARRRRLLPRAPEEDRAGGPAYAEGGRGAVRQPARIRPRGVEGEESRLPGRVGQRHEGQGVRPPGRPDRAAAAGDPGEVAPCPSSTWCRPPCW
jgi:TRAP-type C4-dicarboxylate transport system substrate-binding protein